MKLPVISTARVAVIGAARSGLAAAGLLARQGARVLLSELGHVPEEAAAELRRLGVEIEEGGHSERTTQVDFAVLSPGIPPSAPVVAALESKGVPILSEIELASRCCRARIVGITGTDGKTTTATLLQSILEADGRRGGYRAYSVGNIGTPFSSLADAMAEEDVAVVELSSYQLERCYSFRPRVALITNLAPDHLDRYGGSMERYAEAKYRIAMNQGEGDTLVYNHDDPLLRGRFAGASAPYRIVPFSAGRRQPIAQGTFGLFLEEGTIVVAGREGACPLAKTEAFLKEGFRGAHNVANALAAAAVGRALGVPDEVVRAALASFRGVEHRQEFVRRLEGADWINDSKATNLNALRQALEAASSPIVLIAGGRDKGSDYRTLTELLARKVRAVVTIGEARGRIAEAFGALLPVEEARSLEEAVALARQLSPGCGTVLFSPGCASFDMFRDFEDRGRQFKQCVNNLEP